MYTRSLVLGVVLLWASSACAGTLTIQNDRLAVSYDDAAGTFTLAEKPSGKIFAYQGRLDGPATKATRGLVDDPLFGPGKRIVVSHGAQGFSSLEIYRSLPFVLIRQQCFNSGQNELDVPKVVPATWLVELDKPAGELRTMGTAGLTNPEKNPGSYLFLTAADPATRRGVVAGWLSNDRGSGVVFSGVKQGKVEFRAQIDYGRLPIPPGKSARLETLAVGVFDDARIGEELYADALAKRHQIKLRPQVAGYCSYLSEKGEKGTVELAKLAAKELKPFGFSFVQIDYNWEDGKEYNGPARNFFRVNPNHSYRHGMKGPAEAIRQLGLTAGIWFMPFACNYQDPEYKDRQHWFVKRPNGKPYDTEWGGTSLDLTQPEARAYVVKLAKTMKSWGYDYFKMDGLWTGSATAQMYPNDGYRDDHIGDNAPFHDPMKTNIEVYRDGLRLVREAVGPDVFFSGCTACQNMRTLGGSIGLVDSMRIGPDDNPNWDGLLTGPTSGSRLYFLHGRTWWNDADAFYVRADLPLAQARLSASWIALSGQLNLNGDWIPGLPAERLDIIKRTMPAHSATARPVDYFDAALPSIWLVTDARQMVRRDVLGLFNWEKKQRAIGCTAARAGLEPAEKYYAFDYWANALLPPLGSDLRLEVPPQSCRVIALRAAEGHPLLLGTSRHITQGMVDVNAEHWDAATGTLSGTSLVVAGDPYELRIAGLEDGKTWKPVSATVSAEDAAEGVKISQQERPGLVRVGIRSPHSRPVIWAIRFAPATPPDTQGPAKK